MNNQPKFKKGDSPVSDMLAIPDDHVWTVEWKPLQPDSIGCIFSNGTEVYPFPSPSTKYYLTEADLLKLPFQK